MNYVDEFTMDFRTTVSVIRFRMDVIKIKGLYPQKSIQSELVILNPSKVVGTKCQHVGRGGVQWMTKRFQA